MADVFLDRDTVQVVLSPMEHIGALHGDLEWPIDAVRRVEVTHDPFSAIRGIRSPGTAWPGRIALGTWRSRRHGRTFAAAYGHGPAVVIELQDSYLARVVVSTEDAERIARLLAPGGVSDRAGSSPGHR